LGDHEILRKKGVYHYEYITDLNVLNETCLPTIDKFYSSLNNKNISIEEYKRAKNVLEKFKCNFGKLPATLGASNPELTSLQVCLL
jgi:hypothetical protein